MFLNYRRRDLGWMSGKFFTERVVRCWNRLSRMAVDALEAFKAELNQVLGNLM